MSEHKQEVDEIILCKCGYPDNDHNFRHDFQPEIFIERWKDGLGDFYKVDATEFTSVKIEGKCKVSQCGAIKNLHGPIIKHEFVPDNTIFQRKIVFKLPLNTKCRHVEKVLKGDDLVNSKCEQTLGDHVSSTHAFKTLVMIDGKTDRDIVTIIGKNTDQTIVWKP